MEYICINNAFGLNRGRSVMQLLGNTYIIGKKAQNNSLEFCSGSTGSYIGMSAAGRYISVEKGLSIPREAQGFNKLKQL